MIFGQIASGVGILALAYIAFYKQAFKFEVSTLVKVSFLVLISFVLALFSWMLPVLGFPALKVGFSQIPLILIGFMFGPSWAFLGGLSADIIELISGNIMTPFFGFTLNKILIAMIPALLVKYKKKSNLNEIIVLVIAIGLAALTYVFTRESVNINEALVQVDFNVKLIVSLGIVVLSAALLYAIYYVSQKQKVEYTYIFVLSTIIVELVVNMTLTPIWLYAMYGLPISVSVMVRLLKIVAMVPLTSLIGLITLKALTKIKV